MDHLETTRRFFAGCARHKCSLLVRFTRSSNPSRVLPCRTLRSGLVKRTTRINVYERCAPSRKST
eukprot:7251666-Prymnesium_polylepis.2